MELGTVALVVVAILAIVIVGFLSTGGHSKLLKNAKKNDAFLLLGLADSGKTSLYCDLRFGKVPTTCTSMTENDGYVELKDPSETPLTKAPIHIVDVPGHEKLRFKFADYMPITRGVVFVVDSTTINKFKHSIADYLYDVLSNNHTLRSEISVLVACNKSELLTAFRKEKIQEILESEIDRIRVTRGAALETHDSGDGGNVTEFLGFEDQKFKFEHLTNLVTFAECSVEKKQTEEIVNWIADVMDS
ncbi:P-loop containing nucleoside triphosphate hydrolase protein [Basidiobolus meristosporus CBS 931.73]|uniref:Signal recognition particle receptor subunit beta n=1 Tax=Basidiobolus meristosporus CBS 931.73 TaxID=1314790 RepID=A0A1Y1YAW5_9FUNG|nr:P-loop containing nucleoside triphosphate hydrolase protein [Basidiobolus meristosporus CBS 931.73]|eukprot:ORX95157.1 P-loop containing nucleoside triphosphate hydrolase protein [Basidiobolus meristosporus CBS 931.73]